MDLTDRERAALDYCAPRGIPLSVFLGRVIYPGDPQWLPEDTEAALWWQANVCSCGQLLSESMDPANEKLYAAEGLWCFACRAIHREAVAMTGKNPYQDADPTAGTRYRFTHTPTTAAKEVA
jgi:hypothetical protein